MLTIPNGKCTRAGELISEHKSGDHPLWAAVKQVESRSAGVRFADLPRSSGCPEDLERVKGLVELAG
jgi:hypothetical protein